MRKLLAACLVICHLFPRCTSKKLSAVLSVDRDSIFVGTVRMTDTLDIRYTLANAGNDLLEIKSAGTSCGCSQAYLPDSSLAPDEKVGLMVKFSPMDTGYFKKYVVLETNAVPTYKTLVFAGSATVSKN